MTDNIDRNSMLRVGTMLHGTYRIDSYLASGGFGNTYESTNVQFGERYAIKEFFMRGISQRDENNTTVSVSNSDNKATFEAQKDKFKREAKLIRKLNNEHIVKLYDLFEENGTAYYVMEYIDGKSIANILKDTGKPIPELTAINYVSQVLDALKEVHAHRSWHLDIKPSNIMVSNDRAILIDFGSSKQMKEEGGATTDAPLSYTPGYAPSELMEHENAKFGAWTDFYSLGATLYNMVSFQKPPAISDILEDGQNAFSFPDDVSDKTRHLIVWMMNVSRAKRPQSIEEIDNYIAANFTGIDFFSNKKGSSTSYKNEDSQQDTLLANYGTNDEDHTIVANEQGDVNEKTSEEDLNNNVEGDSTSIIGSNKKRNVVMIASAFIVGLFLIIGLFLLTHNSGSNDNTPPAKEKVSNMSFNDAKGNTFTYSGEIGKDGKPSGQGHGEYDYGIYEGNYVEGLKDGQGKFYEKSGNTFVGTFSNDYYDEGVYFWKKENLNYKGTFYNEGQFYNGTFYDKATNKPVGKMVNGEQQDL